MENLRLRGVMVMTALLCGAATVARAATPASEPLECVIEPHLLVDVSSSEIGVLQGVSVDEADVVEAGQVIAELDTGVERAALELSRARAAASGEIELLRRELAYSSRRRERTDELYSRRVVSAQDIDEIRTAEESARLRLKAATERRRQAELEANRDALSVDRRVVRSPISGVVVERYKTTGEYVEGDPIVQLAQLDPLRIEMVAPIAMLGAIEPGMRATVVPELAMDGQLVATVASIDPIVDAATATFGVRLTLPNPGRRVPPGLKCTLSLLPPEERVAEAAPAAEALPEASSPPEPAPVAEAALQDPPSAQIGPVASSGRCATLGPLDDDAQVMVVEAALRAADTRFERRIVSDGGPESWVVLSGVVPAAADTLRARIERAGITDYRFLTRGENAGRVSFGTYSTRRWADDRVASIRALGFDVELRPRYTGAPRVWLDLPDLGLANATPAPLPSVLEGNPALVLEAIPCTRLASR